MKAKIQTKRASLCGRFSDWLRSAAKTIWSRFAAKGKSFQPLPNEAPH